MSRRPESPFWLFQGIIMGRKQEGGSEREEERKGR